MKIHGKEFKDDKDGVSGVNEEFLGVGKNSRFCICSLEENFKTLERFDHPKLSLIYGTKPTETNDVPDAPDRPALHSLLVFHFPPPRSRNCYRIDSIISHSISSPSHDFSTDQRATAELPKPTSMIRKQVGEGTETETPQMNLNRIEQEKGGRVGRRETREMMKSEGMDIHGRGGGEGEEEGY